MRSKGAASRAQPRIGLRRAASFSVWVAPSAMVEDATGMSPRKTVTLAPDDQGYPSFFFLLPAERVYCIVTS